MHIEQYTGEEKRVSEREPAGIEKRMAAAIASLSSVAPANLTAHVGQPTRVRSTRPYGDYDLTIPVAFAVDREYGRRAAVIGHATYHVTVSGRVTDETLYVEDDVECPDCPEYYRPRLIVVGSDEVTTFTGWRVDSLVRRLYEDHVLRRSLAVALGDGVPDDDLSAEDVRHAIAKAADVKSAADFTSFMDALEERVCNF